MNTTEKPESRGQLSRPFARVCPTVAFRGRLFAGTTLYCIVQGLDKDLASRGDPLCLPPHVLTFPSW